VAARSPRSLLRISLRSSRIRPPSTSRPWPVGAAARPRRRRRPWRAGAAVRDVRRLSVSDPAAPQQPFKVELAANWRALPPVMMDIGPVLHVDDVVAGKMSALFTRAARDYPRRRRRRGHGRYTGEQLLELAEQADAGFDRRILADVFSVLERCPDRRFAAYGVDPVGIAAPLVDKTDPPALRRDVYPHQTTFTLPTRPDAGPSARRGLPCGRRRRGR
jgi:hypothetical protein